MRNTEHKLGLLYMLADTIRSLSKETGDLLTYQQEYAKLSAKGTFEEIPIPPEDGQRLKQLSDLMKDRQKAVDSQVGWLLKLWGAWKGE